MARFCFGSGSTFRFALLPLCAGLAACSRAPIPVPVDVYNIFDVGAADLDGDGWDDFYTLNHSGGATLLRSTGNPARPFEPLTPVPQDPRFQPCLRCAKDLAAPKRGALAYWAKGRFNLVAGALDRPVSGTLLFVVEPVIAEGKGEVERRGGAWLVRFQLPANGRLGSRQLARFSPAIPCALCSTATPRMCRSAGPVIILAETRPSGSRTIMRWRSAT